MANKQPDPQGKIARAEELRAEATALEAEAIREALEACDWLVQPAAKLLGYPRHTTLIRMLTGRHKAIGDDLEKIRKKRGFSTGNPAVMRK